MEAFEKHGIGEANVMYERYSFHQRVQQSGECFDDFLCDLRKMARTCQFEQLEDSLIHDQIVIGIRHEPTRRRLLQQKKLSLSDAIDACKVMVGACEAVDALGHAQSTSSHHRRAKSSTRKQFSREPSNRRRCGYVGGQHGAARESCPAYNKQFRKCTKPHHFEKQCRSTQFGPSSQNRQVCNVDNEEELLALKNGDNVRAYCNLYINGKSVNFMLDCGAYCNVLPRADAIVVNRKSADLKPAKSRLSMYDGTEIKTL